MLRAKRVVIDYVSTSYIEALLMNIPMVLLWDSESYCLNDRYSDFFHPLIRAKICHTDPQLAAAFIGHIQNDPDSWWQSSETQAARKEFLDRNLGNPADMIEILLNLSQHNEIAAP